MPLEPPAEVVLATGNAGKLREMQALLGELDIKVRAQSEFNVPGVEEIAATFVENALAKARNAVFRTGIPAIADDSGISVDALHDAPGVYSARYAGNGATDDENLHRLLAETSHLPEGQRGCQFVCVLVYMTHAEDPTPEIAQGVWRGQLAFEPRGTQGFGYDPIFRVVERGCTSAELLPADKNAISHRGQAMRQLMEALRRRYVIPARQAGAHR